MCAIHQFNTLHMARVQWVNLENIVVFPKRGAEMSISDYRPISLIHAIAKNHCQDDCYPASPSHE
jgi:hypothetical protein